MGNIGIDVSKEELANQLMRALDTISEQRAKIERLRQERNEARANARVLAHAYEHDTRPPSSVVAEAMNYSKAGR